MRPPKQWIEYVDDWRNAPMAYWVHVEQDGAHWRAATRYVPPAPSPVPHKGFRLLCVEIGDTVLHFSSEAQLAECIGVLSMKPLPTTRALSARRGTSLGPNGHWLSRLPAKLKSPRMRERVVAKLRLAGFDQAHAR